MYITIVYWENLLTLSGVVHDECTCMMNCSKQNVSWAKWLVTSPTVTSPLPIKWLERDSSRLYIIHCKAKIRNSNNRLGPCQYCTILSNPVTSFPSYSQSYMKLADSSVCSPERFIWAKHSSSVNFLTSRHLQC